jgi:PDZ domain-containing secreted protein
MQYSDIQIQHVIGSSWTDATKFQRGDLIQAIDGKQMNTLEEIFSVLEKTIRVGGAEITVLRAHMLLTYKLTL